ncbi:MAG: PKD domain-containing protein [Thermoplasmatales archaeon]|nr:PKD domain-containing protein [Thermoplasmatales archaeon]
MKIKEETYGIVWGTVLLVIGLIILLMALANVLNVAQNPAETIEQWVPEETQGPTASFVWTANDKSADFEDLSVEGSYDISSWSWDFGDGEYSSQQNPSHVYSEAGAFTVSLEVEDENGNSQKTVAGVSLVEDEGNNGQSQSSMGLDLGLGTSLNRIAIATLYAIAFAIIVMIGGRFLVAGVRLLRPNVRIYKMKVKAKEVVNKEK